MLVSRVLMDHDKDKYLLWSLWCHPPAWWWHRGIWPRHGNEVRTITTNLNYSHSCILFLYCFLQSTGLRKAHAHTLTDRQCLGFGANIRFEDSWCWYLSRNIFVLLVSLICDLLICDPWCTMKWPGCRACVSPVWSTSCPRWVWPPRGASSSSYLTTRRGMTLVRKTAKRLLINYDDLWKYTFCIARCRETGGRIHIWEARLAADDCGSISSMDQEPRRLLFGGRGIPSCYQWSWQSHKDP